MSKIEIISLIVSIIALVSLCAVFTIFLINFCKKSISDIKLGRQDEDIIISEIERRKKEQSKNPRIKKVFKQIGSISFIAFVVISLSYAIFAKITERQMVFNSKSLAVASGSMSYKNEVNTYLDDIDNQIQTFDLIWVDKVESQEDLQKYDVIAYRNESNTIIIHRIINIIEKDGTKYFYTRGDANNMTDTFVSTFNDIVGIYNNKRIPLVGMFILFLKSYVGIATFIGVVYYVYLYDYVTKKISDETKARLEQLYLVINDVQEQNLPKSEFVQYIHINDKVYTFIDGQFVNKVENDNYSSSHKDVYLSNDEQGTIIVKKEKGNSKKSITRED